MKKKLSKKRPWRRCFLVNIAKFLRTPFLQSTSGRLLLYLPISTVTDLISKELYDYVHLTIQIERWCPFPFLLMPLKIYFWSMIFQTQPTRGDLKKSCSENMQQIYRRTPMPECDFNKVGKQLYWNLTSAWVCSYKFAAYFQNIFS